MEERRKGSDRIAADADARIVDSCYKKCMQDPAPHRSPPSHGRTDKEASDGNSLSRWTQAHVVPFLVFLLFLGVPDLLAAVGLRDSQTAAWYVREPKHWLYPLQTLVCLLVLWHYRRQYQFRPVRGMPAAVLLGTVGTVLWVLPGWIFDTAQMTEGWWKYAGFTDRSAGYRPDQVPGGPPAAAFVTAMRFVRLVVLVPLVEEILWRGFLMRFLVQPEGDYRLVPFGRFHWSSLFWVTLLFVLVHQPPDYAGAVIFGLMMYALAVRSGSLAACVLMHAVANAWLGIYVLVTGRWGYW